MTIQANGSCRWTALAASIAAACAPCGLLAAAPHHPEPALVALSSPASLDLVEPGIDAGDAPLPDGAEELYLEVSLNQTITGQLARFVMVDGRLHASAATLRGLGLRWPGSDDASGLVALEVVPDLQARYDAARQQLALVVPLEALTGEREHFGPAAAAPPRLDPLTHAPGVLLNYDVYAQGDGDIHSVSGWHELRLFGLGPGTWSNSMVSRLASAPGHDDVHDTVRLDTYWQLDLPDSMVSVAVGDTYTSALDWTRTTRIGGVRASRNFALQPYRVTTPLASFAGDATLPSTVDLFINGVRQSSQQVRPGQFQIDSAPVINGAGQAQMVITDINGQSRVVDFALYNTTQLLQQGLTDWSLEAGLVRRDYGIRSFAYADDPMASATVRHGLGDHITVEAHAEGTADLQMGGAAGHVLLGDRGGVLDMSAAGSRYRDLSGHQYGLGWQWNSDLLNFNLATLRRSDGFADVARLDGSPLPTRTDRAFAGLSLGRNQLAAGYVRQDYPQLARSRFLTASWSLQLPRAGYLSLNLSRDLGDRDADSAYLYWSMPLDRRTSASATVRHAGNATSATAEANHTVDVDQGGWGWRAQASAGDQVAAQAQLGQLGRFGAWNAGLTYLRGGDGAADSTTGFANANGSVLLMERHLFAMRRVEDAFALVSTDGIADVPILLENRLVGHTDARGHLLVNRLNAWQNNRLSIDPLQAPADVRLDRTEMLAVPASRSGMLARFPMRPSLSLQATVQTGDGSPVAAGSEVWLADGDPASDAPLTVVGYDGLLFLQDPPPDARLKIRQNGGFCEVVLPHTEGRHGFVELEGVVCR